MTVLRNPYDPLVMNTWDFQDGIRDSPPLLRNVPAHISQSFPAQNNLKFNLCHLKPILLLVAEYHRHSRNSDSSPLLASPSSLASTETSKSDLRKLSQRSSQPGCFPHVLQLQILEGDFMWYPNVHSLPKCGQNINQQTSHDWEIWYRNGLYVQF